ncbi:MULTISPECIES: hypothetical protein [Paenibacillus]|uniref:hypothetical protein n=1 Tax=Paenibacillus TaxID=44249 RepID=UPI00096EB02B|nr:hypothetical protein [Paenibacillus odorifer]OMD74169.1 hypothetical protein BSK50_21320 [Paenibacillus odorifer]
MDDVLKILEKFEGIIGALLGVMLTLIMTEILKKTGKFIFYVSKNEVVFQKRKNPLFSDYDTVSDISDSDQIKINLVLEIFNSSDTPKVLRKGVFSFYENNSLILSLEPKDNSTARSNGHWTIRDGFINANVKNKEIITIDLSNVLTKEQTETVRRCTKVFFEIKDSKNKKYKILLKEF